jgi:polysaccharide chain length determinant protein (PEP-CTERM system associated)
MEPMEFLGIFSRRKWLIVFTFLFILFGAIVYSGMAPDIYKSSTTILVIPQRVPEKFVSSTVTYGVEERLTATSQQILSRTRLMQVIDEIGLYKGERNSTSPEILTEKMRNRIGIQIHGGSTYKDAFVLSFEHEDPNLAMLTTSRLASFFIDENLKVRQQLAVGTSEFLDTQVEEVKKKLEVQEEKVKHYKLTFMGELPQQMEANLNMLTRLQDQRRTNAEAIAKAEDRKLLLESQISGLKNQISTLDGGGGEDPTDRLIEELFTKRKQLEDLSEKYTPSYPTVVQLRRAVRQLEENIAKIEGGGLVANDNHTGRSDPPFLKRRATRERQELVGHLRAQVKSLELDIHALKREQAEIQTASNAIQAKVSRLPQREQEMIAITRDYNNLRSSYDDLLKKKLEATVSQNLEERQKGEQFQVLDPPTLPTVPFKPDRKKILTIGLFAALAFGFGGAIGVEMLDPRLRGVKDFKHFFDLPILASIPIIQDDRYVRRNALRRVAVLGGILSFMGAFIIILMMFGERFRTIIQF